MCDLIKNPIPHNSKFSIPTDTAMHRSTVMNNVVPPLTTMVLPGFIDYRSLSFSPSLFSGGDLPGYA